MRTRINNVRVALPAVLTAGAIALAVAGCGGGHSSAAAGASSPKLSSTQPHAAPSAASTGIPQHNGGDMDTDNNGGPSDGDGNL